MYEETASDHGRVLSHMVKDRSKRDTLGIKGLDEKVRQMTSIDDRNFEGVDPEIIRRDDRNEWMEFNHECAVAGCNSSAKTFISPGKETMEELYGANCLTGIKHEDWLDVVKSLSDGYYIPFCHYHWQCVRNLFRCNEFMTLDEALDVITRRESCKRS